jgi:hypothetical protein
MFAMLVADLLVVQRLDGVIFDALFAGYRPKKTPTIKGNRNAMPTASGEIMVVHPTVVIGVSLSCSFGLFGLSRLFG